MKHLFTVRALLWPMLLAFVAAPMIGACGSGEPIDAESVGPGVDPPDPVDEAPLAIKGAFPPDKRASLGSSPPVPQDPIECRDLIKEESCKKYRIQLLGNPTMNIALRAGRFVMCEVDRSQVFAHARDAVAMCKVDRMPVFAHARDPELARPKRRAQTAGSPRARAKIRHSPSDSRI